MAQGKTKGLQKKAGATTSHAASRAAAMTKKGGRVVPPKQKALVQKDALRKSLSAKIGRSIEQQAAQKAAPSGSLTIVRSEAPVRSKASSSKKAA